MEEAWQDFKLRVLDASERTLGFVRRKHQDWFDDNDPEIQTMLDLMHRQHTAWINDKNPISKKSTYQRTKRHVQVRLRSMKDSWWRQKADELHMAADRKDSKSFFDGLKAVFGPKSSGSTPIYSSDGTLLTDKQRYLTDGRNTFKQY